MLLVLLQYARLVVHHSDHNYRSRESSTANCDVEYYTCYNSGYPELRIRRILRDSAKTWIFQIYQWRRLVKIGNQGLTKIKRWTLGEEQSLQRDDSYLLFSRVVSCLLPTTSSDDHPEILDHSLFAHSMWYGNDDEKTRNF